MRREVAEDAGRHAFPEDLLSSHCLSFCTAVHTHHSGEDAQLFPALRAAAPGLAPVIDKLTEDQALLCELDVNDLKIT